MSGMLMRAECYSGVKRDNCKRVLKTTNIKTAARQKVIHELDNHACILCRTVRQLE